DPARGHRHIPSASCFRSLRVQPSSTNLARQPQPVRLADYRPPDFLVDDVELVFELDPALPRVRSRLSLRRHPGDAQELRLDGRNLELEAIAIDGAVLPAGSYSLDPEHLTLWEVPDQFVLEITSTTRPAANTSLMGLYVSNGIFCTQCEAQG